jgi:hypothetical protein
MNSEGKIWVDGNEPDAMLVDADNSVRCPTLGEAIMA